MGDLTEHFSRWEFECGCGCGHDGIALPLVYGLELLRYRCGFPLKITSGCRCPIHNKNEGGSIFSTHLDDIAADVMNPKFVNIHQFFEYALEIPVFKNGGIGVYHNRLHLDIRGTKARWYNI